MKLTILHTNDLHGHLAPWQGWEGDLKGRTIGGLGVLAGAIAAARSEADRECLLFDAGDLIGDTMIADLTKGKALIAALNYLRYDALTIGNHEPDFSMDVLRERIGEAKVPVVAANLQTEKDDSLFTKPYVMKKAGEVRVRILGLAYPKTPELPGRKRFSSKELHDRLCENCLVVDVRSKEAFASAHIPGSVNIPLGPNLPTWAGWVLPYDRSLVIVAANTAEVPEVVTHLIRVGLDDIQGYLDDGIDAWENHGYEISRLESISVHDLDQRLKVPAENPFVLDVRTEQEWDAGHVEGATHIHGGVLKDRFGEVPKDRAVSVICGSGYRGSIAASFLKREGYEGISNVLGGMTAWKSAGLPVSKA